jgi:hypothetical protein
VAAGTTITDSSLGLTGASYITAVIAWVRAGFAPTNSAYHSTASDGTDVGAVAYAGGAAVPVTSNIRVDDVTSDGGHSSVRFTWDSDLAPGPPVFQQVQYGPDTSYGSLLTVYGGSAGLMNQQMIVSGNAPGSTVHFCPQTCSSAGCSSCVGKDQVVTFPAAPAVHPALPAAPSVTAQPYPSSTAGWSVATAASDCHDLQSLVDAASTHSNAFPGYIVKIPVGSCPPGTVLVIRPVSEGAGGVQLINPYTNMSTVDGTITMTGHGFTLNQTVYIDARLDGAPPGGFSVPPTQYYVVNPTANTFQLSATPSGSAIVPTTTGSDVWISPTVVPNRVPIIIRSAAPDSATPKPGVRFDPAGYAGCLAVLQTNDPDISTVKLEPFTHDVHFGPCIEVTQAPQFASGLNLFDQHLQTAPLWDQGNRQNFNYISLDRVWIHGPGCPDRTKYGLKFDGANVQLDSSVIDNIAACRPNYSGFAASKSGSTINVAAGTYYFLLSSNAASASSVTVSGSGTGTIFVTLAPGTAVPKFYLPAGISGVCSGCTIVSSTLFDFPRDGFGHLSEGPIASISVSSGVLGVAANAIDVFGGVNFVGDLPFGSNAEGGEAIDVVSGPGPMMFTNNFFHNNRGITLFIEDTGATYGFNLSDFYIARNTFAIDDTFNPASGTWNHLNSLNRHQMEVKTGHKIMATGNVFSGQFGYGQPSAMAMLLASNNAVGATPPVSIGMSDLTATYNTIHDSAGGIGVNGGPPGGNFPHIARRVLVANNLLYNINAWQHTAVAPSVQYSVPGWAFYLGFGGEDWTLDHNTVANVFGPNASWVYWIHDKQEGVAIRNNVAVNVGEDKPNHMFVVEGSGGTTPQCWFDVGKAAMDCSLTPNYSFINNALGAGFTNSQAQTGNSSATMAGAYTSVDASNTVLSQSTVAARIAAMGWRAMASGDFRFNVASTFAGNTHPAADGYPVGADLDAIDRAQGHISNLRSLLITSSGATIYFQAPDAGAACYAKVVPSGASDLTTASTFGPDTAQSLLRSIALTGLSTATAYDAYAMCSGATNAPSVTFTTH